MSTKHALTKLESLELTRIAAEVQAREDCILRMRSKLTDHAGSMLSEAVQQGQALIKIKSIVPFGLFENWLSANCPSVSHKSCRNYMRLARNMALIGDSESIYQALRICDAEGVRIKQAGKGKQSPAYLRALYLFSRATKYITSHPLDQCPDEVKTELR